MRVWIPFAVVLSLAVQVAYGSGMETSLERVDHAIGARVSVSPVAATELAALEPTEALRSALEADPEAIADLIAWNRAGKLPVRNGLIRPLDRMIEYRSGERHPRTRSTDVVAARRFADGKVVGASVTVEGAARVRLHLTDVHLPDDAVLVVWGVADDPVSFGNELATQEGDLWTPSVSGDRIFLELQVPERSSAYFMVDQALEILPANLLSTIDPLDGHCVLDASCIDATTLGVVDAYRLAVAQLNFVTPEGGAVCSGALLNDIDTSTDVPYLLTANHCFSTQAAAQSLEAVWDYRTPNCNGPEPALGSLPRSNGSSLLATSLETDMTMVRLNSVPAGRVFLGWTLNPSTVAEGAVIHRISHPFPNNAFNPRAQSYTRSRVTTTSEECEQTNRPQYIYSVKEAGATFGGSSGAPSINAGGQVVGQLLGGCGSGDECSPDDFEVDGAFALSFPLLQGFLADDGSNPECQPCTPNATKACLLDGRFEVTVTWRNAFFQPVTEGVGSVIDYAENVPEVNPTYGTLSENAFFSMFAHAPNRVELIVKMFKGVTINDMYWVTAAGMTNNEYTITVVDTQTCQKKQYFNPHNRFTIISDTAAFPFP